MSRAIAESLSLLSETLNNCKTNLTEKQVADVDNIKISDVDEKIAEIQAGGGKLNNIKDLTIDGQSHTTSYYFEGFDPDGTGTTSPNIKFTVTEDDCLMIVQGDKRLNVSPQPDLGLSTQMLENGTTYTITGDELQKYSIIILKKIDENEATRININNVDFIGYSISS